MHYRYVKNYYVSRWLLRIEFKTMPGSNRNIQCSVEASEMFFWFIIINYIFGRNFSANWPRIIIKTCYSAFILYLPYRSFVCWKDVFYGFNSPGCLKKNVKSLVTRYRNCATVCSKLTTQEQKWKLCRSNLKMQNSKYDHLADLKEKCVPAEQLVIA